MTVSSNTALQHLKKIKPNDGWSIQVKPGSTRLVRLVRRSIPITDGYFFDIHYDKDTDQVVGILTGTEGTSSKVHQGQVLVDSNGRPVGQKVRLVSISNYKRVEAATTSKSTTTTTTTNNSRSTTNNTTNNNTISDQQNKDIMMYGVYAIGAAIALRIVANAFFGIYMLAFPLLFIYMITVCPTIESFDAKKELKRVLRGHHLPEDHPDKPKGFLSQTLARLSASVATELATFPGYEVTIIPLAGAALLACTRVPTVNMDYYFLGAFNRWWFVYGMEVKNNNRN